MSKGRMTGEVRKPRKTGGVRTPVRRGADIAYESGGMRVEFGESRNGKFHSGFRPGDTFVRFTWMSKDGFPYSDTMPFRRTIDSTESRFQTATRRKE